MKRFLLILVCCSPLLFSSNSFSIDLIGPSDEQADTYGQYGPTSAAETLWGIATKLRPNNSVSVQQTLVAIYKANPNVFTNGNINKLIPKSIIFIPELNFIRLQTDQEAITLINKNSKVKQTVQKAPQKTPVKKQGIVKPTIKNKVEKKELAVSKNELKILENEFNIINEQLLIETDNNQSLKVKQQALYDQIERLKEQIDSELLINKELQTTIDSYRAQLDAVVEPPFSGEGVLNSILRAISSSLMNLLIAILSPVLLLLAIFVVILRLNSKRKLAEQEQELAESTAILMEESGKFDSLLTEDISESEPEVDFASDDSFDQELIQEEAINIDETVALDELGRIDLSDTEMTEESSDDLDQLLDINSMNEVSLETDIEPLEASKDDPFGIAALAEESSTSEDDPFGIAALVEEESNDDGTIEEDSPSEDDPFGIAALAEEMPDNKEEDQANIDLAAEWESQLSEERNEVVPEDSLDDLIAATQAESQSEKVQADDIEQDDFAKQINDRSFNEDVPLPKVDPEKNSDFIDIDTLLESNEESKALDQDLGLDEDLDINIEDLDAEDPDDDENGIAAQLDLARAYLEIDDKGGAKEILLSIIEESHGAQRLEIEKLLSRLNS